MRSRRLVVLAVAAALGAAGCASAGAGIGSPPSASRSGVGVFPVGPGSVTSLRRPLTPKRVAERLVASAQVPKGAVASLTSPTNSLRRPPSVSAVSGIVERIRWWTSAAPYADVYRSVARHQSAGLVSHASAATNGPRRRDVEKSIDFTRRGSLLGISSATLTMAVAPLGVRSTAIAAYAIVVRQPARPAAEIVPLTVGSVLVTSGPPGLIDVVPGRQLPTAQRLTGLAAQQLARDFNQLQVLPPRGRVPCPQPIDTRAVTFSGAGHVWLAACDGCAGIDVRVDGHRLPTLAARTPFTRDLRLALPLHPGGYPKVHIWQPLTSLRGT